MMKPPDLAEDPLMSDLRTSIDRLDIAFIHLLAERTRLVRKLMWVKMKQRRDLKRSEARQQDLQVLIETSVALKLDEGFFGRILDLVFQDAMERFSLKPDPEVERELDLYCRGRSLKALSQNLLNLDYALCYVLAERFDVVKRIGVYKHSLGIRPYDPIRWQQLLSEKITAARALEIDPALIRAIFETIHQVSLRIEDEMALSG
jgi:chorismate mutase